MTDPWQQLGKVMQQERQAQAQRFIQYTTPPKGRNMNPDSVKLLQQTPLKAARLFNSYRLGVETTNNDPMLHPGAQLYKVGELRQQALNDLEQLKEQVEMAAVVAKKRQEAARDRTRPEIDADTARRTADQFRFLVERGNFNIDKLVARATGDPVGVRILQEGWLSTFVAAENPDNPDADKVYQPLLDQAAYDTFSDAYRQAHDELQQIDKAAYMAEMAVNEAVGSIRSGEQAVIADDRGQILIGAADK